MFAILGFMTRKNRPRPVLMSSWFGSFESQILEFALTEKRLSWKNGGRNWVRTSDPSLVSKVCSLAGGCWKAPDRPSSCDDRGWRSQAWPCVCGCWLLVWLSDPRPHKRRARSSADTAGQKTWLIEQLADSVRRCRSRPVDGPAGVTGWDRSFSNPDHRCALGQAASAAGRPSGARCICTV